MIDYNDAVYVEWDKALEGLRAAHENYPRKLDDPEKAQAREVLARAQAAYEAALDKIR